MRAHHPRVIRPLSSSPSHPLYNARFLGRVAVAALLDLLAYVLVKGARRGR